MIRFKLWQLITLVVFFSGSTACLENEEASLIPKIDEDTLALIAQPATLDRAETVRQLQGRWKIRRAFRNGIPRVPEQGTRIAFSQSDFAINRPRSLELHHEYQISGTADDLRISFSVMINEKVRTATECEGTIKIVDGTPLLLFREAERSPAATFEQSDVGYLWVLQREH